MAGRKCEPALRDLDIYRMVIARSWNQKLVADSIGEQPWRVSPDSPLRWQPPYKDISVVDSIFVILQPATCHLACDAKDSTVSSYENEGPGRPQKKANANAIIVMRQAGRRD